MCTKFTYNMHQFITVQLNYSFTIPFVNLHGSLQCHGWFLLKGIGVPRVLLCMNVEPCDYYHEAMHAKQASPVKTHTVKV